MFKKKTFDWNKFPAKRHALIIVWFGYFYILVGTGWRSSSWDCCARPSWGCPTHCATGDWPRKNIIWQEWQEYNMTEINLLLSDMLLNLNCFIWLLFVLWLTPDDKVPVLHEIPVHVHHDVAYPTVPLMTSLHTSPTSAPTTSTMQWSCSTPASSPPRGGRACVPVRRGRWARWRRSTATWWRSLFITSCSRTPWVPRLGCPWPYILPAPSITTLRFSFYGAIASSININNE